MSVQEFNIKPSVIYIVLLLSIIVTSLVMTLLLPFPAWARWPLLVLLSLYSISLMRHYALLTAPDAVLGLNKLDQSRWQIRTRQGVYEGNLLKDSLASQLVSVLRFRVAGKRAPVTCVIWCNSLPRDDYRRMLVLLKQ